MTNDEFQTLVLEKLENMDNRIGNLEQRVEQTQQMTVELLRIVGNTNAMLEEMKEDIVRIVHLQDRQSKVLESVSIHLLEHEADIRELRRAR